MIWSHASSWSPRSAITFAGPSLQLADVRDHARRVRAAIYVVPEEDHRVLGRERRQPLKQREQRRQIAVDIPDGKGPTCHTIILM